MYGVRLPVPKSRDDDQVTTDTVARPVRGGVAPATDDLLHGQEKLRGDRVESFEVQQGRLTRPEYPGAGRRRPHGRLPLECRTGSLGSRPRSYPWARETNSIPNEAARSRPTVLLPTPLRPYEQKVPELVAGRHEGGGAIEQVSL